ncbi:MAG: histidine kinase [Christensenellaceae bacterium]
MNQKFETWCYGGKNKHFFQTQSESIHQYNSKMMDRLLLIMTIIIGCYLGVGTWTKLFSKYSTVYLVCFAVLLVMLCTFKLKMRKSITYTRIYMLLFSFVMFAFVCVLGTVFEPGARATLFIVYVLALPMLFIVPTHYMYAFLITATGVFSIIALQIKGLEYAEMDIAHGVTCLAIGIFISRHILQSRMALYAVNEQLDARNMKLDKQLQLQQQQLLQSRISILLSQIQPHFLYNTLTVICGLCDENPKEAKKVTAEFADYLRHNLDTLNQCASVPFADELRHIKVYLYIEKKRFESKLQVVYDIKTDEFRIPSLTVQPLVENAVKHGVLRRKNGGVITISTQNLDGWYEITIADDGVGFDVNQPQAEPNTHIGIQNVRDRLWSLCKGTLTINSEVGTGTKAVIKIPKEK